jgi:MoxR-like ATPase
MTWNHVYSGTGEPREVQLPPAPPWRRFPLQTHGEVFQPPAGLVEAVNAALWLRRPLLITGPPGSGKSTAIESVAAELKLGDVLRWHITSRSTLPDALYRYDVLGRIHAQQIDPRQAENDIATFLRLGPLGTALAPRERPRALLIDEIDKSDLDLPSDLLDVLERGTFEIPELVRYEEPEALIREWDGEGHQRILSGRVQCLEFPFIVMTSNGERDFPGPFLRRCIRFEMPPPTEPMLRRIVEAHLARLPRSEELAELITDFTSRLESGEELAVDQLLNAAHVLAEPKMAAEQRAGLKRLLMRRLSGG